MRSEHGTIAPQANFEGTSRPFQESRNPPRATRLPEGPLDVVHVFWLAGMSCDGCTVSVSGATHPRIEGACTAHEHGSHSTR